MVKGKCVRCGLPFGGRCIASKAVAPSVKRLGDYTEELLKSINITEDNWKEIKQRFGFAPTCSCQKRKAWLNNVSEVFLGKINNN
tara:strand:- start:2007 stop:2261 length:255 start_codon:yes stop_codon:yes gene_type:complete